MASFNPGIEEGCDMDEERAERSVIVSDIPAGVTEEQLMIHFQRQKNGGGEVSCVSIRKQSAVITFDESEVAKRVIHRKQELGGGVLQLQPCKQARHRLETKVFSKVTAQLEFGTLPMKLEEAISVMNAMKAETNITWHESSYAFIISGSFSEIQHARKFLTEAMEKQEDLSPPSRDVAERPSEAVLNDHDHSNTREEGLKPQVYETNERFRKYLCDRYQEQLKDIEQKFNTSIQWSQKLDQVILKPGSNCEAETFSNANEVFLNLYQDVHKSVSLKRFTFCDANQYEKKRKIISEICKEYKILIEKSQDRAFFEMFGEEEVVNAALKKIGQIVQICLEVPALASGNYEAQASVTRSVQTQMPGTGDLWESLPGDVKISVYQGDITDQRVDAIVNAANEWLAHGAGVSEAIQRKGGHIIYKESKEITSRQGPVKVGKAVITNSGNLPCKLVIHAVGPDWLKEGDRKSKALLKAACLNSLKEAEELEVDSIAIPAISSGSYGMPKEVCAEVMFSAVEEYSTNMAPGFKVNDVRFVNIDDATVRVFREEFLKRYGQPQGLPSSQLGLTKERQGFHSSQNLPGENANSRENRQQSGGALSDVSSKPVNGINGQPQHQQVSGSRKNRGLNVKSGGNGLSDPPKPTQHHSSSDDKASSTGPMLYSVAASHGTSTPDQAKGQHLKDPLTTPASSKRNEGGARRNEGNSKDNRDNECSICLDTIKQPKGLKDCKHKFCKDCIDQALKVNNRCPVCLTPCGALKGNQPPGTMTYGVDRFTHLPGFGRHSTIEITYNIPSGTQTAEHPNPGQRYEGTRRMAYLPDTKEGREVLRLLRKAFDARLVFTVGTSATSGLQNQVTWNDIHHKTSTHGGSTGFGYPDPTYLSRVKEELAVKGIK